MILAEQDDEWQDGRRYLRRESLALIDAVIEREEVETGLLMATDRSDARMPVTHVVGLEPIRPTASFRLVQQFLARPRRPLTRLPQASTCRSKAGRAFGRPRFDVSTASKRRLRSDQTALR
jgi:hypothetical protein